MSFRASFHTLGCRLNQADSAHLASDLAAHGYSIVPWGEAAEVLVINSCAVTATAVQKTRQLVSQARSRCPLSWIVVCGCAASSAELLGEAVRTKIDLLLPNPKPQSLFRLLPAEPVHCAHEPVAPLPSQPLAEPFVLPGTGIPAGRTRANLKIQDGCNFRCTYCIVPQLRGPARSRDLADILREARELIAAGQRELVLTGVNIATWRGKGGADLADLCAELLALEGNFRLRLGSTEPGPVLPKLIELMHRDDRICRFLHLPLQYGEDSILRKMARHYNCGQYAELLQQANERLPGVCLGTDLMVGFPGEDDEVFARCLSYLEALPLGLMHVFSYSRRPNTPAAAWPLPPGNAVACREKTILALSAEKTAAFARSQCGKQLRVLLEPGEPLQHGWSDNYLKVVLPSSPELDYSGFHDCVITGYINDREVKGEVI